MTAEVFDDRRCALGEGPLWHPARGQLFWFDILGQRLLTRDADGPREWVFTEMVSAAGWIDRDTLLIASERRLFSVNLATGAEHDLAALEADRPQTRSNDGRADPQGGFWIGTMGKAAEPGAGALYRWYRGGVERLATGLTIPNAICFAPDGRTAYYTDTATGQILRQPLDAEGWPDGAPSVFADLAPEGLNPDGAVVDAEGCLWNAQWGAGRVARYSPEGAFLSAVAFPATQISCPALANGALYATSAAGGAPAEDRGAGQTFRAAVPTQGQREHNVDVAP